MLSYLLYFYVILNSLAKVIHLSDIRKQFITFLIENLSNYHKNAKNGSFSKEMSRFYMRLFPERGVFVSVYSLFR